MPPIPTAARFAVYYRPPGDRPRRVLYGLHPSLTEAMSATQRLGETETWVTQVVGDGTGAEMTKNEGEAPKARDPFERPA